MSWVGRWFRKSENLKANWRREIKESEVLRYRLVSSFEVFQKGLNNKQSANHYPDLQKSMGSCSCFQLEVNGQ